MFNKRPINSLSTDLRQELELEKTRETGFLTPFILGFLTYLMITLITK